MNLKLYGQMKQALAVLLLSAATLAAQSQAVLPASWGFDTSIPEGWMESLGDGPDRYAQGADGQACRLDNSGEFVLVSFVEEPGEVEYFIKGQPASSGWNGSFVVEESADGNNFTALRTFTPADIPTNAFTHFSDQAAASTRHIRFRFSQKITGNVGLDEVSIHTPEPGDEQEIHVTYNGASVPTGMIAEIGNSPSVNFAIHNLGLQETLVISNISLSGANASQFALSNIPTSLAPGSSHDFTLSFDGAGEGSKTADILIHSNDADENPYIIHVWSVAGSLASEPTQQASSLTFNNLLSWDYDVSLSGTSANYYLLLRKKGSAPSSAPVDGTTYLRGEWIGDAQVVHSGPAATFNARYVEVGTTYYYASFAYNGSPGFENYLTTNPLVNSVTTLNSNPGTLYNNVNPSATDFIGQLNQVANPFNYTQVYYSNYIGTLINDFYVRDTVQNGISMNAVECQYSGDFVIYPAGFQFLETGFSREHCFPQSWMPTNSDFGFANSYEYSDLHNLLPVKQNQVNSVRSNYPYGNVATPISSYLAATYGFNANDQRVYEPRDPSKGDAARAMMYHALKYTTPQRDFSLPEVISESIQYGQDEYVLKQWHFQDLPDGFEKARNEYIYVKQKNRNPFIDYPEFACFIRFADMSKWMPEVMQAGNLLTVVDPGIAYQWFVDGEEIPGATSSSYLADTPGDYSVSVQQFEQCPLVGSIITSVETLSEPAAVTIYPNPSKGHFRIDTHHAMNGKLSLRVFDIAGKEIHCGPDTLSRNAGTTEINLQLPAGVYILQVMSDEWTGMGRVVVE